MKLSPSTIAANLSAAAAAEAEAANSNSAVINVTSLSATAAATVTTATSAAPLSTTINSTTSTAPMSSNPPGKSTPKDTQVVAAILKEMGITDYEPRVLPQLVEFAYRYASRVLEDAQLFSSYAKKKVIDNDDISIAVQMQLDRSFVGPPSRDALLDIARTKNSQPLPAIKSHNGMRLPADRYSLVASNLRLASGTKGPPVPVRNAERKSNSLLTKLSNTLSKAPPSMNPASGNITNNQSSGTEAAGGIKRRLDET